MNKKTSLYTRQTQHFLAIDWLIAACCANSFQLSEINWAKSESHTYTFSFGAPSILLVNKISLAVRRDWQAAWHFYAIFASICMCHRNSHNSFRWRRVQLPHWCDTFRTPKGCANGKDLSPNIKHTGERHFPLLRNGVSAHLTTRRKLYHQLSASIAALVSFPD